MIKEIILYQSSVHISDKVAISFFKSLTDRYFDEIPCDASESMVKNITFTNEGQFDTGTYPVSSLSFQLPSATPKIWASFKRWCKQKEVDVSVKKKIINRYNNIWWPSIIEISTANDNDWLVVSKLEND